jgi:hypothetical protein
MYPVSTASKDGKIISSSSRKRGEETPLVRQRQTTALNSPGVRLYAEKASAYSATASSFAKRWRHRNVAGSKRQRHTGPHSRWVNLREQLKHADISRKADLQTIVSFLRQVLPSSSIAEPGEIKLGAPVSRERQKRLCL